MVLIGLGLQVAALLNERYKIGDELKRSIRDDILRLIEAKTYRWAGPAVFSDSGKLLPCFQQVCVLAQPSAATHKHMFPHVLVVLG